MEFLFKANAFQKKVSEKMANVMELNTAVEKLEVDLQKES